LGTGDGLALLPTLSAACPEMVSDVLAPSFPAPGRRAGAGLCEKTCTAKAEWRRTAELGGVVTVEQDLAFARALFAAARDCVTDRDTLRRLNSRVLDLLPPGSTN
jgi:hypothetical protein